MKPVRTRSAIRWIGWLPLVVFTPVTVAMRNLLRPWEFMWALAFAIYIGLKWLTWWNARPRVAHSPWRSVAYLLAWPGMDAEAFLDSKTRVPPPPLQTWGMALFRTASGALLVWVVARAIPTHESLLRGWIGMIGLILVLHFGSFQCVALFWQRFGFDAKPIMSAPLRSQSLGEFWGKRWNLGFRQLSYDLIFRPLHRTLGAAGAGFLVFVASGLIHDLVISVPARGGYGLPTAYFMLQGLGVVVERLEFGGQLGIHNGLRGWLFMAVVTVGPVYWLFHPPFVQRVILPFMQAIHAL
jgi:Membrane bound O-acyl transferase family